jgi:outer membrane protein OmpA-like peptidoglycan-associated protein
MLWLVWLWLDVKAMALKHTEDHSLSHSMTDLMTSLAVIFILLLVVYLKHNFDETQQGSTKRIEALRHALDKALIAQSIRCEMDANKDPLSCTIRVRDDKLQFGFNSAALTPRGQGFLHWMTPRLTDVLCKPSYRKDIDAVFIQGFTDSAGDDNTNLKLSAERSFEVLSHALNKTGLPTNQKNCLLDLSSTSGRGERELLRLKSGQENANASRRVEFTIRIKSYEMRSRLQQVKTLSQEHSSSSPKI